jgi:ectoine hydroxylase-related dioxygenase (phytanoyl-CoA dioxygenase family)
MAKVREPKRDATGGAAGQPAMAPFVDSSDLVASPDALRARFDEDGYVFLKDVVDTDMLADVRSQIVAICDAREWFKPGTDPIDAVAFREPCVEGEEPYFEVYDEVQKLEAFHAVPHDPTVRSYMTALLGDSAFPHPLSICRLSFPSNEEWTTPPHQDHPNNQGTEDLYASWIPLSDCPVELGGLSILPGSHRLGMVPMEFALGPGNRKAKLDDRFEQLDWVGGDLELGDALVFHSLTMHRALPNTTDRMRLSVDYRFQREHETLTEGCLEPHFGRLSWDEIYSGWGREDLKYYWRDKQYTVVPWDATLHPLSPEHRKEAVRKWMLWQRDRRKRAGEAPTPGAGKPQS